MDATDAPKVDHTKKKDLCSVDKQKTRLAQDPLLTLILALALEAGSAQVSLSLSLLFWFLFWSWRKQYP